MGDRNMLFLEMIVTSLIEERACGYHRAASD